MYTLFGDFAVTDTAGQEEYSAMQDQYMRSGDGFLLVFSVTDHKSFIDVQKFQQQILRNRDCKAFPMLLVGNKTDLIESRNVTSAEAQAYCEKVGVQYIECSARLNVNVVESFHTLVRIVRKFKLANDNGEPVKSKAPWPCCIL